jgi:DNA repair exonuclease SbcCD ATPase subunit
MEALAQRDEARATKDMHKERQEEAWAEVERLKRDWEAAEGHWIALLKAAEAKLAEAQKDTCSTAAAYSERVNDLEAEVERLRAEIKSCQGPQWYKAWKESEAKLAEAQVRAALTEAASLIQTPASRLSRKCAEDKPHGGRSALRATSPRNPRSFPCPTCGTPNVLTPKDKAKGYQCNRCADSEEGCF